MMLWTILLIIGVFAVFAYLMTKSGCGCCGGHNHQGDKEGHVPSGNDNKSSHGSCCGM